MRSFESKSVDLKLRPVVAADRDFLLNVYAATRADEMAMVPWSEEQKREFVEMQFNAQDTFYRDQFKDAVFQIVELDSRPIGRLYVDRRPDELRVIDIALLSEQRGKGIGGRLMQDVIDEAAIVGKKVRIHVERSNPAMRLYERLGFTKVEDQGVYWLMEWAPGLAVESKPTGDEH